MEPMTRPTETMPPNAYGNSKDRPRCVCGVKGDPNPMVRRVKVAKNMASGYFQFSTFL